MVRGNRGTLFALTLAAALVVAVFVFTNARAQTATDTPPIEGETVLPDGTVIEMLVQKSPTATDTIEQAAAAAPDQAQPSGQIKKVASIEAYLGTLTDSEKLDMILNKLANTCTRR